MVILNFSHPLTPAHLAQIETLAGQRVARVIDVPVQVDHARDLVEQVAEIAEAVGLPAIEWQTLPLLVNLPGYAPAAAVLLAELHGRTGYFPDALWLRPVENSMPLRYEVADILRLQNVRLAARRKR
ncbi:MAG: hypothetical protein JXA93_03550 [Anaerolineae bacterium]|nr:hypothetical protein [Anaerolineae bacterium]